MLFLYFAAPIKTAETVKGARKLSLGDPIAYVGKIQVELSSKSLRVKKINCKRENRLFFSFNLISEFCEQKMCEMCQKNEEM